MQTLDCEVLLSDLVPCFWPSFVDFQNEAVSLCINNLKETSSRKKLSSNEKSVKNAKSEPSLTSMCQMLLEISYFKVRNLSKIDVAVL